MYYNTTKKVINRLNCLRVIHKTFPDGLLEHPVEDKMCFVVICAGCINKGGNSRLEVEKYIKVQK